MVSSIADYINPVSWTTSDLDDLIWTTWKNNSIRLCVNVLHIEREIEFAKSARTGMVWHNNLPADKVKMERISAFQISDHEFDKNKPMPYYEIDGMIPATGVLRNHRYRLNLLIPFRDGKGWTRWVRTSFFFFAASSDSFLIISEDCHFYRTDWFSVCILPWAYLRIIPQRSCFRLSSILPGF